MPTTLDQAAAWLRDAHRIVALTGAGISAESGVPTFRGTEGLWRSHDPMALATPDAFRRDPGGVWAWYRWRQQLVARCAPNAAHDALVRLEQAAPSFLLATQNVDGLHQRAGSKRIVELHGNLFADRCSVCGTPAPGALDAAASWSIDPNDPSQDPELPHCEGCGGLTRPGVVWFGEQLPEGAMEQAADAAAEADVLLVVGTSGIVYPAAGLAQITHRAGGRVIVVNLDPSPHDATATVTLSGRAGELLPKLVEAAYG